MLFFDSVDGIEHLAEKIDLTLRAKWRGGSFTFDFTPEPSVRVIKIFYLFRKPEKSIKSFFQK
jgi:hypothetical protein